MTASTATELSTNAVSRDMIVSKAMRRLGNNESLLVVVHSLVSNVSFHWHGRALLGER